MPSLTIDQILTAMDTLSTLDIDQLQAKITKLRQSPLLRLPGEIRNQIYSLAVRAHLETALASPTYNPLTPLQAPPLFHTNRQIRHECLGLYPRAPLCISLYDSIKGAFIRQSWAGLRVLEDFLEKWGDEAGVLGCCASKREAESAALVIRGPFKGTVVVAAKMGIEARYWATYRARQGVRQYAPAGGCSFTKQYFR